MLIDIHVLQNHSPSNLNRDDTGAPKDAVFGGYRRGRISSQCLKRSIRYSEVFRDSFGDLLGTRTRRLPMLIDSVIQSMPGVPDDIRTAVISRVAEIGTEGGGSKPAVGDDGYAETNQLIFLGSEELGPLATSLVEFCTRKGVKDFGKMKIPEVTKELSRSLPRSVDIAMFGRMTTSNAFEDVAAAVQVAHAITTGKVDTEFDYYTAIDDLSGEAGAGMIGDVEFNSSTYYKYFSVHWENLVKNLGGDHEIARRAVQALVEAAVTANPSGKQNSFAAHNVPDLVLVEIRERNIPLNYANAFVSPCRPGGASR